VRWTADGRSIYVTQGDKAGIRLFRLELATGRKEPLGLIKPADAVGVLDIKGGAMTADGKAYVYNDRRTISDLYIVEGIQ